METGTPELAIVTAGSDHLDAIVELHISTIKYLAEIAPAGFGESIRKPPDAVEIGAELEEAIAHQDACVLAALVRGRLAGFALGFVEENGDDLLSAPYLTVQYLEVHPDFRGRGVAAALMREMEVYAQTRGCCAVELAVWEGNAAAKALYEKLGYVQLERRLAKVVPQSE